MITVSLVILILVALVVALCVFRYQKMKLMKEIDALEGEKNSSKEESSGKKKREPIQFKFNQDRVAPQEVSNTGRSTVESPNNPRTFSKAGTAGLERFKQFGID